MRCSPVSSSSWKRGKRCAGRFYSVALFAHVCQALFHFVTNLFGGALASACATPGSSTAKSTQKGALAKASDGDDAAHKLAPHERTYAARACVGDITSRTRRAGHGACRQSTRFATLIAFCLCLLQDEVKNLRKYLNAQSAPSRSEPVTLPSTLLALLQPLIAGQSASGSAASNSNTITTGLLQRTRVLQEENDELYELLRTSETGKLKEEVRTLKRVTSRLQQALTGEFSLHHSCNTFADPISDTQQTRIPSSRRYRELVYQANKDMLNGSIAKNWRQLSLN